MYHMPLTVIPPFWGSQSQLQVNKQTKQQSVGRTKKENKLIIITLFPHLKVVPDVARASSKERP